MWIRSGEKPSKAANIGFQCPKVMLCIFWGPAGIASIHILQKRVTMNSTYFISNVLKPIKHYDRFIEANLDRKKFYIHFDNCPSHRSKIVKSYFAKKNSLLFLIQDSVLTYHHQTSICSEL